MIVIAVTRQGFGDILSFGSRAEADSHPIVQYGDAIVENSGALLDQYNLLELPRLLGLLDDEQLRVQVLQPIHPDHGLTDSQRRARIGEYEEKIWNRLVSRARPAPTDPVEIVQQVRRDRAATLEESKMAKAAAKKPAETDTENKDKAAAKPAKEPKPKPFPDDAVIHFGTDKAGKKYDAGENNPKRKGTKAHEQFAKLKEGQKVSDFVKAIGNESAAYAELKWCVKQAYITIDGDF